MKVLMTALALLAAGVATAAEKPGAKEAAKPLDPKAAEVAALKKELGDVNCGWGQYVVNHARRFGIADQEIWPEEKVVAAEKRCLEVWKRLAELTPDDEWVRQRYGEALLYYGRPKEAVEQFSARAALHKKDDVAQAETLYWLADAQFASGDRAAAVATLAKLVEKKIKTWSRHGTDWSANGGFALKVLTTGLGYDEWSLPCSSAARPFPEPRKGTYTEKFVKLTGVKLTLAGVAKDDARVKLLAAKCKRLGIALGDAGAYELSVALDPKAPVAEKEGYSLAIGETKASVRARDGLGVLWGVVSFVQAIDPKTASVRQLSVEDWPETADRGCLITGFETGYAEFMAFMKLNSLNIQSRFPGQGWYHTPLNNEILFALSRQFRSLGLTLYYGLGEISESEQMAISDPRTLPAKIKLCKMFAAEGAGVYYPLDDVRFPLLKADLKAFGSGANCDAKQVNDIFQAVVKDYPDFKMIFCPPFYWGPDSGHSYPEDRDAYLKSIRQLDPRVDVYWTGPQVKGYEKKPYQVKWFADLTGHKPSIFQNVIGRHNKLDYGVDPIAWDALHYDGFCREIGPFHNNTMWSSTVNQLATEGDWLWNPKGYDAKRAAKAGANMFCGDGYYEALEPGLADLTYFDRYPYGQVDLNIVHEDAADLERKLANAKACYAKMKALKPVREIGRYADGIRWAEQVVKAAKNPPDFMKQFAAQIDATRKVALAESKCDEAKGDRIFTAVDLRGLKPGKQRGVNGGPERFVKWMRGAQSGLNAVSFVFECDPFPPTGDYTLSICGIDDELPGCTDLRITVNGTEVYKGPGNFPQSNGYVGQKVDFALRDFRIPFASMKRYNTVTVENASPGYNKMGTPYVGIHYMVLRKSR